MRLKIKILDLFTGNPVAIIHPKTADYLGIKSKGRILISSTSNPKKSLSSIVDISPKIVKKNQIAISHELEERLSLKENEFVEADLAPIPKSLVYIKKKLNKGKLNQKEINHIIGEITNNSLAETEIALFISSMYTNGMDLKETIYLINSILNSGQKLSLNEKFSVDKHSIGGVPANRTTPIIVSICAAAGLIFPKSSSRAITSAAGTADVIESVARVDFSIEELKKIVKKTNACLIWGGSLEIVPADEKIISIEKSLNIDPESQLLASIMSKKLALGANYILIDIPYGKTAKVNKEKALRLKKKFEYLGKHFKRKMKVVLTKGDEPIGNGIGPVLEMIDILKVLNQTDDRPLDLERKSLFLAGEIFDMTNKTKKGEGINLAKQILESKKALQKFKQIIKAQDGDFKKLKLAKFRRDIICKRDCLITEIDNKKINSLARIAGCPFDKSAGVYLYNHVGARIKNKDKIITIFSESKSRLKEAIKFFYSQNPIKTKNS